MISFSTSLVYDLASIVQIAKSLIKELSEDKIWVFEGEMGAGKTTLIKHLAAEFGVVDQVSSPTFGIVNEYSNDSGQCFYHFDFYRIENPEEAFDIGIDEYFYGGDICWIEWAGKIEGYLPDEYVKLTIEDQGESKRKLTLERINYAE